MKVTYSLLSLVVLATIINLTTEKLVFNKDNLLLQDADTNEYKVYHGVNVAYKTPPYVPPVQDKFNPFDSFSDQDAKQLHDWGFNVLRTTFYWEGVEPQRGNYNDAYLDKLINIADTAAKYNISVILDLHQDAASRLFCGEGMPDWAVQNVSFPDPMFLYDIQYKDGYPTPESCTKQCFGNYYWTYGVQNAFQRLYDNADGIRDAFLNMWQHVAGRFKDVRNLIAYEIINEPWVGNTYSDNQLILEGDENTLEVLQKLAYESIRKSDPNTLIFFSHTLTDSLTASNYSNLKTAPGGDKTDQALSYHIYCAAIGDPTNTEVCNEQCKGQFSRDWSLAERLKVGAFMTEFGAVSGQTSPGLMNIKYLLEQTEVKLHSWAYWQYKYYNDVTTAARPSEAEGFYDAQGKLIQAKVDVLNRPYFTSICGDEPATKFEEDTQTLILTITLNNASCTIQKNFFYFSSEKYGSNLFFKSNCTACQLFKLQDNGHYMIDTTKAQNGKKVTFSITTNN